MENTYKISHLKKDNFPFAVIISIIFTIGLSIYIANLLFGNNSVEIYNSLKDKKIQLQRVIKEIQLDNAKLQKNYLALKNLEPPKE